MDRDLNLEMHLKKEAARQEIAEFGQAVRAQTAADLSQVQAAEQQKVQAAKSAHAAILSDAEVTERAMQEAIKRTNRERVQEAARALAATMKANEAARKQDVADTIAAEQAKVAAMNAFEAKVRVFMKERFVAFRDTARQEAAEAQAATDARAHSAQREAAISMAAGRKQLTDARSRGTELARISEQSLQRLGAGQADLSRTTLERASVTQTALEMEVHQVDEAGRAYARVRIVQQTATREVRQLGGATAQSMAQAKGAVDSTTSGIDRLGKAFIGLQVAQQIAGAIQGALDNMAKSAKDARDHIKGIVDEMEEASDDLRELAALRGEQAGGNFSAQVAREASAAGLETGKYKEFQLGFQAQAGQHIGAEEATPEELEKAGQKISGSQARALQQRVASYAMGARGMGAEESSGLLGTVLAKSKAGASNDQIMSEYAKLMKVMELAPGRTSPLLGQLSELGMESVGPQGDFTNLQQAGYLIRTMAQRNPGEASTYSRALTRGLRDISMDKDKQKELGITGDMDVFQQLEQLDIKAQEHVAKGGKEGEFIQKYFPEIREFGAVRTALNEGIRGGGFQRAQAEAASVDAGTADAATKAYMGGEVGVRNRQNSALLAEKRQNAAFYEPLKQVQRDQLLLMEQSHELEIPEGMVDAFMTGKGEAHYQGTRAEQQLRKRTAYDIDSRLMNSEKGKRWLTQQFGHDKLGGGREQGHLAPNADERTMAQAAQILKQIHAESIKANRLAEARNDRLANPAPLAHPTPLVQAPMNRGGIRP
jgi:hypothetical protein